MRNLGDIIASIVLLFVGIGATIGAIRLRVGTPTEPQPGFFPFLGGVILIGLSGVLLFQAWRRRSIGFQDFGKLWGPAAVVLGLVVYVATLEFLGYLIATTILAVMVLRVLGTKSLWVLIATSLILVIGSYVIFNRLLDVPLSSGILSKFW